MMGSRRRLLVLVVSATAFVASGMTTFSSLSQTTANSSNSFATGTVTISDNDAATAMLTLTNAIPGSSDTGCLRVTYTGTLPATVRLYGSVSGGLAPYLTLTVTRGTDSAPSFDSCTTFVPDATNYIGQGPGVVFSGALSSYPTTYAAGVLDPPASPSTWTTATARSYKFSVTLVNNSAAQNQTATATFNFEARNQ